MPYTFIWPTWPYVAMNYASKLQSQQDWTKIIPEMRREFYCEYSDGNLRLTIVST